ncbi:MAG: RidA family protein [Gammaproteobacteria bacterium]|nr:RidA family protein [Gammaproteobacteria bacterium]
MPRDTIQTDKAPEAIGPYSQAVRHGDTLYISGQVPLDPATMELVGSKIDEQIGQVLDNLDAICQGAGATLDDALKFTVYLTDLVHFQRVNEIMANRLTQPYPARAAIEISALPKGALIEIDAIIAMS